MTILEREKLLEQIISDIQEIFSCSEEEAVLKLLSLSDFYNKHREQDTI